MTIARRIDRYRSDPSRSAARLLAALLAVAGSAQAQTSADVAIDDDDIGGVVMSRNGPEAGVWVIAETSGRDTRFARIVVTDDQGRFVVPDLPDADYSVWVRGYGRVDSQRVAARPGEQVALTVAPAAEPAVAAGTHPAIYWYSMMRLPSADEVAAIPGGLNRYIASMTNLGCIGCHHLGQRSTRTIPASLGEFESSIDAWTRRLQSGQAGGQMIAIAAGQLGGLPLRYLADWTDRIAAGELPRARPARPRGVERNVVVTVRRSPTA